MKNGKGQSKIKIHGSRDNDALGSMFAVHVKARRRMKGGRPVGQKDLSQSFVLSRLGRNLAEGRQMIDDGGRSALGVIDPPDQYCNNFLDG